MSVYAAVLTVDVSMQGTQRYQCRVMCGSALFEAVPKLLFHRFDLLVPQLGRLPSGQMLFRRPLCSRCGLSFLFCSVGRRVRCSNAGT